MRRTHPLLLLLLATSTEPGPGPGIASEEVVPLPPPAARSIDFLREVHPLLAERCFRCHGGGNDRGGLRMDSRELLLAGGKSGPAVLPGKSGGSYLIRLVSGLEKDKVMPKQGPRLTPEEVGVLRAWIDQGLVWPGIPAGLPGSAGAGPPKALRKVREADLSLRRPPVPGTGPVTGPGDAAAAENPIDLFLAPYWKERGLRPGPPVEDRLFLRRAHLDGIGLLPSPREVEEFLADQDPSKRERLVRRLLTRSRDYAEHWLSFWNDLLRNDYQGTGYIDGGRKQISAWLYEALVRNKAYDAMVAGLVSPDEESSGFLKGIVWRGVTNASQTPAMQAAQSVSQVFMGINLKCASCHDSFVSDWTLKEAYGLAGVFAEGPLEMVRCDAATGERAPLSFLYPELGKIDPGEPLPRRRARLAEILTRRENGRLARTIVNRLWARFFGRGLVEPLDEMETPSWHGPLLDWLAADLVDHGYDLKHSMARILTSRAYALPAAPPESDRDAAFVFRGPAVRRMTAEQFVDAMAAVTGVGRSFPRAPVDFSCLGESGDPEYRRPFQGEVAASWIWADPGREPAREPETVYFRNKVHLAAQPEEAILLGAADDRFTLFLNGKKAAAGSDFRRPVLLNLLPHLSKGENTLSVEGVNASPGTPAGLFLYAKVRGAGEVMDFATGGEWLVSRVKAEGWEKPEFRSEGWTAPLLLGDAASAPWSIGMKLGALLRVGEDFGRFRASLAAADPLMTALGRPNREQVVASRSSVATTLEALELTNGSTMAEWLRKGAARVISEARSSTGAALTGERLTGDTVARLYRRALGRAPSAEEEETAGAMAGDPIRPEGVEDLLWCLTMLPEFQLIY